MDGKDLEAIEADGVERSLGALWQALGKKRYRTDPARRLWFPWTHESGHWQAVVCLWRSVRYRSRLFRSAEQLVTKCATPVTGWDISVKITMLRCRFETEATKVRTAVMAAGAVGGYFGARLAAAGAEVHFIARGAHLDALRRAGLAIRSPLGDVQLPEVSATDNVDEIGAVDVVLFAVKLWDTESAGTACQALVGPDTVVVNVQNGVDGEERLISILGNEHVAGGCAYIASVIEAPGVIVHGGQFASLRFGELDGRESTRLQTFKAACDAAGFDASISTDVMRDIWEKFVLLVGMSGATALLRSSIGPILSERHCREFFHSLIAEAVAVGRARGISLGPDCADERMAFADTLPESMKSSMLHDLERGNRLELDWFAGAVVTMGEAAGIATPANCAVRAGLRLYADGKQ